MGPNLEYALIDLVRAFTTLIKAATIAVERDLERD